MVGCDTSKGEKDWKSYSLDFWCEQRPEIVKVLMWAKTWSLTFLLVAVTTLVTNHKEFPKPSPTWELFVVLAAIITISKSTSRVTSLAAWITSLQTNELTIHSCIALCNQIVVKNMHCIVCSPDLQQLEIPVGHFCFWAQVNRRLLADCGGHLSSSSSGFGGRLSLTSSSDCGDHLKPPWSLF